MKKLFILSSVITVTFFVSNVAVAAKPTTVNSSGVETSWASTSCATIQSGTITDSAGNVITTGFDQFGYNYQAHMFNGTYDSSDRVLDGKYFGQTGDYVDDSLIMKWSDSWLANVDCDGNGKLDRGLVDGVASPTNTSMGWLTNHLEGDYVDGNGDTQHYTGNQKIVWTGPGSSLWGEYTLIEDVYNDPSGGYHGLQTKIGTPGLGLNDQWTTH